MDINMNSKREPMSKREQCHVILLVAVWMGILTGLGELIGVVVLSHANNTFYWFAGVDAIWTTPLADLLVFLGLGLALAATAWFLPRLVTVRFAAFACSFVTFVAWLWMIGVLNDYAVTILAAGLAIQASTLIARHYDRLLPLIRYLRQRPGASDISSGHESSIARRQFLLSAGTAGATVVALAAGGAGRQAVSEWWSLRQLSLAKPQSPNVLFIVLDTVRASNTSVLGYRRQTTPYLAQLASQSTLFTSAISAAPWTLPSHSSMFTGRYCHELSADWTKPLDDTYPTLAEAFSAHGYETAGFVGNYFYVDTESGLSRGFLHFEAVPVLPGQLLVATALGRKADQSPRLRTAFGFYDDFGRKDAERINSSFLHWLSGRDSARPFFAFLNYFDAHAPYLPPTPFDTAFGPTWPRTPVQGLTAAAWPASEVPAELSAYDGALAYLDQQVGLLIDHLDRTGQLQNTLVVIVGDHGEEFNEHGVMQHGSSLYLPSVHVPLLVSFGSRVPAGRRVDVPVTLRDLASTIVSLTQLPNSYRFPGQSLTRFWDAGAQNAPEEPSPLLTEVNSAPWALNLKWGPVAKGPMKSLVVGRYHYIRNGDATEEVYDILDDPWETRNLAQATEDPPALADFRAELGRALASSGSHSSS